MWWNIFMTVFGLIIIIITGAFAVDSYNSYRKSNGELKKAWRRAYEGWVILSMLIVFDTIGRILKWVLN
jgi:hypothetical protein